MLPTPQPSSERLRASRRRAERGRRVRLRDRDVDILVAVAKLRLARTSDLTRLFFGAAGTCQKRMRRLFDAGLVRTIVPDLASENRYALTPLGHRLLHGALDEEDVPAWRPAPRVDSRSLAHLDLLNKYRVALATGVQAHRVELPRFSPDWELRSESPEAPLIPDAAVVLRKGQASLELAIEIDVGTEAPSVVRKKVATYESLRLANRPVAGLVDPTVIFVVATLRRARSLARTFAQASHGGVRVLVAAPPFVLVDGGLSRGLGTVPEVAAGEGEADPKTFRYGVLSLLRRP